MTFEIQRFRSSDALDVAKARKALMQNKSLLDEERVIDWWFCNAPFKCELFLAFDGPRPVSTATLQKVQLKTTAGEVVGAEIGNTITDPDYRRMGLFSSLVRTAEQEARKNRYAVIYGTPNLASTPAYAKLGWEIQGEDTSFLVKTRPDALLGQQSSDVELFSLKSGGFKQGLKKRDRFLASDDVYLDWRFGRIKEQHTFSGVRTAFSTWHFAFRKGSPGGEELYVLSDFDNMNAQFGAADFLVALSELQRSIGKCPILFQTANPDILGSDLVEIYRPFPLCVRQLGDAPISFPDFPDNFRLTNCDFG